MSRPDTAPPQPRRSAPEELLAARRSAVARPTGREPRASRPAALTLCLLVLCFPAACATQAASSPEPQAADPGAPPRHPELAAELIAMRDTDQAVRAKVTARLGELGASDPDLSVVLLAAEQSSIDRRNTTRLKEIVATVGWPTAELVGAEASQAAWLLAQHADHDIEFQEHVLELVRPLVGSEGVRPADLALLTDRVRVGRGEPQLYGSQWLVEKVEGVRQLAPATPIEDPQRVDERRAAAELPSLAVYLGLLREAYGLPEDAPTRPE